MPLDAPRRLCLVRVKVERAKKHLCDLEKDLTEYRGSSYTVIGPARGPKTDTPVPDAERELQTLPIIPFDTIAASGDIIQNLRSSPDHLAYPLVIVATSDPGPHNTRPLHFPTPKHF